jgi:hypothetical protein
MMSTRASRLEQGAQAAVGEEEARQAFNAPTTPIVPLPMS